MRCLIFLIIIFTPLFAKAAVITGNPSGKITLTEVFDYQCPHCHRMYPIINQLIKVNPDLKVRLLPVPVINKNSLVEASVAIVATKYPGEFNFFTHFVMSQSDLTTPEVYDLLKRLGLYNKTFLSEMHASWVEQQVSEGIKLLKKYHFMRVPLIVIYKSNQPATTTVFKGEQSLSTLQEAINHAKRD